MPEKNEKSKKKLLYKLRDNFTTGLLVLAPTAITLWILIKVFIWFDNILGKWYTILFEYLQFKVTHIPGLGAATLAILVTFIGYFTRHYVGKKLLDLWEAIINRVPIINGIYTVVRQLADSFRKDKALFLQKPVLVEYPRLGLYSLGFVTQEYTGQFQNTQERKINVVYIPTTPNPTTGLIVILPAENCIALNMSVEDTMKAIISAGIVFPKLPSSIP